MRLDHDINDPIAWGRRLIETKDIDPIYDMLVYGFWQKDGSTDDLFQINNPMLSRWLIAYWCFYHAGVASHLATAPDDELFWLHMRDAARNTTPSPLGGRWPRSPERRHFRGEKCVAAVKTLAERYPDPRELVYFISSTIGDAPQVMMAAKSLPLFGPWIAFKVADMVERVLGRRLSFPLNVAMYASPAAGAKEAAELLGKTQNDIFATMLEEYRDLSPPGLQTRGCGVQEVETVLCKWHSAKSGHYFIGKDTEEIPQALGGWGWFSEAMQGYFRTLKENV